MEILLYYRIFVLLSLDACIIGVVTLSSCVICVYHTLQIPCSSAVMQNWKFANGLLTFLLKTLAVL